MKTHHIKLNIEFCDAVLSGDKCFEVRRNDRGYQKGDHVVFIPFDGIGTRRYHKVEHKEFVITYVLSGWGLKEDYVAFGIKEAK